MNSINTINDCNILQRDLDNTAFYFKINKLKLNASKSKSITFHNKSHIIQYTYIIDNSSIERVQEIRDLGIILDSKLNFKNHIEYIISKAKSRLAWLKRFAYEFDDPWVLKKLYSTFILPIIEYASPIWSPSYYNQINRIESIQKQFMLYALRNFKWTHGFKLPPYRNRLILLQMNTLEHRRIIFQVNFIFQLIKGKIYSPYLLQNLNFRVRNRNTRNQTLLNIDYVKTPFNEMKIKFNNYFNIIDLNLNVDNVKQNLKNHLMRPYN